MKNHISWFMYKFNAWVVQYLETFMVVLSIFTILCFLVTGCSSSTKVKKQIIAPPPLSQDSYDTGSVQLQINRGLALFNGGHYREAANHFEKAGSTIGLEETMARNCLIAVAVCRLVGNDKAGFVTSVEQLKRKYEEYDLLIVTDRDARVRTLIELSEKFQERSEQ